MNIKILDPKPVEQTEDLHIGMVIAEWNAEVTGRLKESALNTLQAAGVGKITCASVPGAVEIPRIAQQMLESEIDAVICYGCVIRGETGHYDFVCQLVTDGCGRLNLDYGKPVIFGVLTTDTLEQALARAGGDHSDVGASSAQTALDMLSLQSQLEQG